MPETIGSVLQPYFASPSMSSISLIASLIKEIIKAKPAYKKESLKNFTDKGSFAKTAFRGSVYAKNKISTVHAVRREITIFPMSNFLLKKLSKTTVIQHSQY